jgi:hypothetical protein
MFTVLALKMAALLEEFDVHGRHFLAVLPQTKL